MTAITEEVMTAIVVMEDTKGAATTILQDLWVHSEVPITAHTTLAVLPPLAAEVLSQVVDHVAP